MIIFRSILLRMGNVSDKICRKIQNTHFMANKFFLKIELFMRYVSKFGTAGRTTDYNAARAPCMLDN